MNAPIPNSYWVDPQRLAAGEYPGALSREDAVAKLDALRAAGISSFIDLTEEAELEPYEEFRVGLRWHRLPIRDTDVPAVPKMRITLDRIDDELARGEIVYVHCWGGHGRTGTVVGCWLVRHGLDPDAALARITELRRGIPDASRPSPEFPHQREFVHAWKALDAEALLVHALRVAAPRLEQRARDHSLGEKKDLHPEMVVALRELVGDQTYPDRRIGIPGWDHVGNVDLTVTAAPPETGHLLAAEEKWDKLDEECWDLFKMGLVATRADVTAAFLVCGVSMTKVDNGFCADLVNAGRHSTIELCRRRYPTGGRRFVWDWMLEGGHDHSPTWVPADIETRLVTRVPIDTANADLRIVRVSPAHAKELIPFTGGWPNGERPPDARRPLLPD